MTELEIKRRIILTRLFFRIVKPIENRLFDQFITKYECLHSYFYSYFGILHFSGTIKTIDSIEWNQDWSG